MSVAIFSVFRTVLVRRRGRRSGPHRRDVDVRVDPNTEVSRHQGDRSWRESRTMREIAAIAHWPATSSFEYGDRAIELNRGMVTGNFFDVLGARPALGRTLQSR
jgi:hypothetical protein